MSRHAIAPAVTAAQVRAYAGMRGRLNAQDIRDVFHVSPARASELLAQAASGFAFDDTARPLTNTELALMRDHRFSASEARAAQRLILTGEIHHG